MMPALSEPLGVLPSASAAGLVRSARRAMNVQSPVTVRVTMLSESPTSERVSPTTLPPEGDRCWVPMALNCHGVTSWLVVVRMVCGAESTLKPLL